MRITLGITIGVFSILAMAADGEEKSATASGSTKAEACQAAVDSVKTTNLHRKIKSSSCECDKSDNKSAPWTCRATVVVE